MSAEHDGWRLAVDRDKCIGSGICVATAPDHFSLVDNVSVPSAGTVRPDDVVIDAAEFCPVEAITVRDAADNRVIAPPE